MSINHDSSETPQASLWWTQQQQQQQPTFLNPHTTFNLNNQEEEDDENTQQHLEATPEEEVVAVEDDAEEEEKEAMFEKALTPSDVGKLNRLVIPKQHAEKYFPLGGDDSVESNKGLLLSFEDESGKCWRFRYSYWNSSQSYVLTKGWSRYVKDKRLDAGDVVLFQRHRSHPNRLFIRWRRRHPGTGPTTAQAHVSRSSTTSGGGEGNNGNSSSAGFGVPMGWTTGYYYPMHHHPFPYQHDSLHAGGGSQGQNETTAVGNVSSSRVLRLFGVNMECQQPDQNDSETLRTECSFNQRTPTHHFYHHHPSSYNSSSSSNPHHHMVPQQPH